MRIKFIHSFIHSFIVLSQIIPAIYTITAVLMVEKYIIANIAASPVERVLLFVLMYVEIFKTDISIFIGNVTMYLRSHWAIISVSESVR